MRSRLYKYASLDALAAALNLPRPYLRELAETGQIPALRVRHMWRFEEAQVRAALRRLARETVPTGGDAHGIPGASEGDE